MRCGLVGLSVSLLLGCGNDQLDCSRVAYHTCDIRQQACQELVFDQMRCLRGNEDIDQRPRVTVVSEAELRSDLRSALDQSDPDPELDQVYAGLAVLGLINLDDTTVDSQVDFQLDALLGFYSHDKKAIVVVDHGVPLDDEQATTTLGHEYIHALQDSEFGLARYQNEVSFSYDAGLSGTSLIEGEAILFDGFQLARIVGRDPADVDWLGYYGTLTDAANEYSADERSPVLASPAVFPYTYGGYTAAVWHERSGQRGIERARSHDLSTESFLARRAESTVFVPDGIDSLADLEVTSVAGVEPLGAEGLGAWLLHSFAVRELSNPVEPYLANYWRGDVISLFFDADTGATEFVWKIRWNSTGRAADFSRRVNAAVAKNEGSWQAVSSSEVSAVVGSTIANADLSRLIEAATSPGVEAQAQARRTAPSGTAFDRTSTEPSALTRALGRFSSSCWDSALGRSRR